MAQHDHPGRNANASSLSFLCIKHDHNCPTILSQDGGDCTCKKLDYELHSSPERFTSSFAVGRTAHRKAEREAAKALRKARRK